MKPTRDEILSQWDENEETMGEQSALMVACEMLGITHDEAMEIITKEK